MTRVRGRNTAMSRRCFILDVNRRVAIYHDQGAGEWHTADGRQTLTWRTRCGQEIPTSIFRGACLPRWRADQIAQPCRRCYPGQADA